MSAGESPEQLCATCRASLRPGSLFCVQCGTAAPEAGAPHDPLIGTVVAQKFRVLSVLGEGGMGKVYKAEQVPLAIDVVIKVLHPQLAGDAMVVKRFFREAQAASRLRHPNSVSILDFGDSNGTLYIAMEFLRGKTLSYVLEHEGRFEPRRAVRVIGQVLEVLETAHRMNIVHRDLKPDNIMIEDLPTQRDFVKVLDFGIAKIVERDSGTKLTQTGMIFGTPQYMAPEQASGDPIDARTDLYAVGAVMYELLTGSVPFRAPTLAMLLAELVTKPAPPIASLRPDLPARLAALVDSALAKAPSERPQNALELKTALEECIAEAFPRVDTIPGAMRPCPSCGHMLPTTAKFCGECGASTVLASVTHGNDKFADLRRFLPTGVVDELAQIKPRASGDKREIVVAAFDLGGALVESEDSQRLLGELYAGFSAIAVRRGGALERRTGAGAIMTFGLHALNADDAERAVAAAFEARDFLKSLRDREHVEIDATCAIHAGAAIVEHGERGPTYVPVGDVVELPTRLASTVDAGKIVISERIREALRDHVVLRQMESVRLKGRAAAVAIHEVASLRTVVEVRGTLARPPTVGRDALIDAILRTGEDAKRGRAIHLVGEPGSGKSRVVDELLARWTAKRQLSIALAPHGRGGRIEPALVAVGRAIGGGPDSYRALGMASADAKLLIRYFEGGGGPEGLGEAEQRMALVSALRAALELLGSRVPVALVADDLHLAAPITYALIARCAVEPTPGVTVITTARPGYPLPWDATRAAAAGLQAITLPVLPDDAIAQLVAGALAPTPVPRELTTLVASRAGGSPLMALEVLRVLVDQGLLRSIGGRWTVSGDLATAPRPEGLRALLAARIDALPARARDLLACAAVFSEPVAADLLRKIAVEHLAATGQNTAEPIDRDLQLLLARSLLVDTEGTLAFAEPSAREAITDQLARDARARIHLAIGRALDAAPTTQVAEEMVGEHFFLGGDHARALAWLERGAEAALRAHQRHRAASILKKARDVVRTLPASERTPARVRRVAEDTLRLGDLLLELGDLAALKTIATEGLAGAHAVDDPELIARARRLRGRTLVATGELDAAISDLDAALNGALGVRNKVLIAELHADLGEAHEKKGELAKALELMMSALELAQGSASTDVRRIALRLLTSIGRVCVRNRELDRAQRFLQQGLELAQELDDQLGASKVLGNLAGVYHARNDFTTAIRFVRRALDLSRDAGDLVGVTRQLNNLGTLYAALGDATSAASNYDAAFQTAQRCGWREGMAAAAAAKDRLPRRQN
jgi:class 3 adenylate cyclase/tetratricopeptide (TPR) repeat protein